MNKSQNTVEHWDHITRELTLKGYSNELLAEHKKTYLDSIARWEDVANARDILMTRGAESHWLCQWVNE